MEGGEYRRGEGPRRHCGNECRSDSIGECASLGTEFRVYLYSTKVNREQFNRRIKVVVPGMCWTRPCWRLASRLRIRNQALCPDCDLARDAPDGTPLSFRAIGILIGTVTASWWTVSVEAIFSRRLHAEAPAIRPRAATLTPVFKEEVRVCVA